MCSESPNATAAAPQGAAAPRRRLHTAVPI
jgi:hypothetical protein